MAASTGSTKVDAVVQNIKAETPEKKSGLALYSRFALAGAVCCSVTHGGLTPVDVYVQTAYVLSLSSSIASEVVLPCASREGHQSATYPRTKP